MDHFIPILGPKQSSQNQDIGIGPIIWKFWMTIGYYNQTYEMKCTISFSNKINEKWAVFGCKAQTASNESLFESRRK